MTSAGHSPLAAMAADAAIRYRHLALQAGGTMGSRPGERRFPGRPQPVGIEVESHAPYAAGDDLRHLDWSALARLDALLMRRFTAEREVIVHVLLDLSASMTAIPADRKRDAAIELTLALAAIALASGHAVRLVVLGRDERPRASAVHRRLASLQALAAGLDDDAPGGALDLGDALGRYARQHPSAGAALVVSDLLAEPAAIEAGVRALRTQGFGVVLLQVLGPSEIDPTAHLQGGVLVDAESGATHAIVPDADTIARYRALLAAHHDAVTTLATRTGARAARLVSDTAVSAFVTGDLVRLGVVRPQR